jgi:hypothetical protein
VTFLKGRRITMEPRRQEISRTTAALLDAAFDDDQERADQLLAGRDDLAAQVTAGLAQVITGSFAGSNHDLAPYFAKALAWDIAEGVMDGHDEFRAVIKEWMLRLAS